LNLCGEISRGAIDDIDLISRMGSVESPDDLIHGKLQIGGGSNGDFIVGFGIGLKPRKKESHQSSESEELGKSECFHEMDEKEEG